MTRLAFLLALALLVGCADGPDPAAGVPAERAASAGAAAPPLEPNAAPAPARPATAQESISIEGMEERIDLRLVTVDDVPLPFSTYVPADWSDETANSGEGAAVRFAMGEGVVTVFMPSEPNRDGIGEIARAVAESNGDARPLEPAQAWVRSGYTFGGNGQTGSVRVGEHAGLPFYVVEQYPYEMGDGFAPRAALVLNRLRWSDDGTAL